MKQAPAVAQLRPMMAPQGLRKAFTDPGWLYEIKFDGYRCMAAISKDDGFAPASETDRHVHAATRVQLRTKSGKDCSAWYPEVVEALAKVPGGPHVIDGEACVLVDGVSDFNLFQQRARRRRWYPGAPWVTLCAFDVLVHDGEDVTAVPLVKRKALLRKLLAHIPQRHVLFVQDLPAEELLFRAMQDAGLKIEGVVAKRKDSSYRPGVRSEDWLKIKMPGWQDGRLWRDK